ncbi:MAG: hypothetical protein ACTSUE_05480 [Promethearchaeota archaeon]
MSEDAKGEKLIMDENKNHQDGKGKMSKDGIAGVNGSVGTAATATAAEIATTATINGKRTRGNSPPTLRFSGVMLIKLLHLLVQAAFIPLALERTKHIYQIIIPLPTGFFIIISIILNLLIFSLHLADSAPFVKIFDPANQATSNTTNGRNPDGKQAGIGTRTLIIQHGRLMRRKRRIHISSATVEEIGTIHEHAPWMVVYILAFGWNTFLVYSAIPLLRVNALDQGGLFLSYGMTTLIFYIIMFMIPELKVTAWDLDFKKNVYLVIPSVLIAFPYPKKNRVYLGSTFLQKFRDLLNVPREKIIDLRGLASELGFTRASKQRVGAGNKPSKFAKNLAKLKYLLFWVIIWTFSNKLTFNFYNYQFIDPVVIALVLFELRNLLYNNEEKILKLLDNHASRKPIWYYIFWGFVFYEIGFKAWYTLAFVLFSSNYPVWIPVVAWCLYILNIVMIGREMKKRIRWAPWATWKKILLIAVAMVFLFFQFSALLSTLRIIDMYFSVINIGPII